MKGVPVRVEIGQKDLEKGQVCIVRRDTGEKMFVPDAELETTVKKLMEDIQQNLFNQAKEILDSRTLRAHNFEEFTSVIKEKHCMADVVWCGDPACEDRFKAEVGATIRCFNNREIDGNCVCCGKEGKHRVFVARSY